MKYEGKLTELGNDNFLTPQEERQLVTLKAELKLRDHDIAHTVSILESYRRLTRIQNGELQPKQSCEIILKKDESCFFETSVQLVEQKTKSHYVGGSRGVSVRIAKGLSYRVGGFKGERISEQYNEITDSGTLTITDKRIVFTGHKKSVAYQLNSITNVNKFNNGISFQKENEAKPKYFMTNTQSLVDEIGLMASKLIEKLN